MKGWPFFNREEEKTKMQAMLDVSKPFRKRLSAVQSVQRTFEKSPESNYTDKEKDFFVTHGPVVCEVALGTLASIDPAKAKGKSVIWEDVMACLTVLIDMTKYNVVPSTCIEGLIETAKICLYEGNFWEIRKIGFDLLLHVLNTAPDNLQAQQIMLAAVDLSAFSNSLTLQQAPVFPERSILVIAPQQTWIVLLQDWMRKQRSRTPIPDLEVFKKFTQITMDQKIKECMWLLDLVLNYSRGIDVPPYLGFRPPHFNRWYQMLKRTLLYLLYPSFCNPGDGLRREMGMQDCHPSLQLLVITWMKNCIEDEVLRDVLIASQEDYTFVMNVLGKSFEFEETSSKIYIRNAKNVTKIYESWLKPQHLPKFVETSFNSHVRLMLDHIVNLFALVKDVKSNKIQLIKKVNTVLSQFRGICRPETLPVLVQGSLNIAKKLMDSAPTQMINLEVVDPTARNILETLKVAYKFTEIPWQEFKSILHIWADNSEFIVTTWKELLLELTAAQRQGFDQDYTKFLYLLGDPLKWKDPSQYTWVTSWREVLGAILKPAHQTPAPNILFKLFMPTLSKIVRESKYERCACEALDGLMDLLSLTRCGEPPQEFYLLHLARLLYLSIQRLAPTVLKRGDIILSYAGMHVLAPKFLKFAGIHAADGIRVAYACLCLPNHYKDTPLVSQETNISTYGQLKPLVHQVLTAASGDLVVGSLGIYGITVCVMDEVMYQSGLADQLVKDYLVISVNKGDASTHASLQCLNLLAPVLPHLSGIVLSTIISCLQDGSMKRDPSSSKEGLILEMLDTLTYWCMSSSILTDDPKLCNSLFQVLLSLQSTPWRTNFISRTVDVLTSLLCFYYQNFPLKGQSACITHSVMTDQEFGGDTSNSLHFAFAGNSIITILLGSEPGKLVIRNQFGRFCWSMTPFRVVPAGPERNDVTLLEKLKLMVLGFNLTFECDTQPAVLEDHKFLTDLLNYVKDTYPETQPLDMSKPIDISRELQSMTEFEDFEERFRGVAHEPQTVPASFCTTRAFLGQLSLLSKMTLLESGDRLDRALGILDKLKGREPVKVGVIYVANSQQNEKEILANDHGSPAFHEFVKSLGQVVSVDKYEGNLGGLDTTGSNGRLAVTWSDWKHDVAFHVVPMMPTDYKDDQQINKKRHVGNDYIHIVWSEHSRDYRAETISSNFNFVHIVVYPLPSQLYRVQVFKKIPDVTFGPVQDEMVLSKHLLGPLLRATAINANDAVRRSRHDGIEPSVQSRRKQLEEIVSRYRAASVNRDEVLAALFKAMET